MKKTSLKIDPLLGNGGRIGGVVEAPPDKSITHRAVILSALRFRGAARP